MTMKVFVNSLGSVTAIYGGCVYVLSVGSPKAAFDIVETWLRGGEHLEMGATDQQRTAAAAVKALILADCAVGNRFEMEQKDDPRLCMCNVNPTGRAGSSQWAINR